MRTLGNQLLAELTAGDSRGVFARRHGNAPWDVDPALRRPAVRSHGARAAAQPAGARDVLDYHAGMICGIDLERLVRTEHFSGADLAHLCETAAEYAMADSIRRGKVRMIGQHDFDLALKEVRATTGPWFSTARNVAMFANEGGAYDDLVSYLKKRKLL
jgi:SpoVK/Ycf46/Vps4 family AAA+-type ATPase